MSLSSLINQAHFIRGLDSQTNPVQPLKIRVSEYLDSNGAQAGHRLQVFLYNATGAATVDGQVCMVAYDGDEETNPSCIASATTAVQRDFVVSDGIIAVTSWGWWTVNGYANVLVEGTTDLTKDDYIQAVTAAAYAVEDTTSQTADSIGIYCDVDYTTNAVSTGAPKKCFLFGGTHLIG